tara:strand:- start:915 stop:1586 length:672 start_codon:yes stop_codon:yes gene_type:complete
MQTDSTYLLCKKIFRGNKQGSKLLNENLLAAKYGVSRASLREALKILKSKGIIKSKQKTGTVIEKYENLNFFDRDILEWSKGLKYAENLRNYFVETRLLFEPEITYLCAKRIDLKNKKELSSTFENLKKSVKNKDAKKIIFYDLAFHKTIILNCGNPILYPLLEFINHILELNFRANQNEQKNYFIGWEKKYLTQHEDLKNFILKNQAIKAKNKMISIISENY